MESIDVNSSNLTNVGISSDTGLNPQLTLLLVLQGINSLNSSTDINTIALAVGYRADINSVRSSTIGLNVNHPLEHLSINNHELATALILEAGQILLRTATLGLNSYITKHALNMDAVKQSKRRHS